MAGSWRSGGKGGRECGFQVAGGPNRERVANHDSLVYTCRITECSMVADSDSRIAWHRAQLKKYRAELKQIETVRFTVGQSADARAQEKARRQSDELRSRIRESAQVIARHDKQTRRPLA